MKETQIIYKSVEEIQPYENNPRNNESAVAPVAESIRQFGFKVPIIVDKDGVIVAGHTRLKAALELGMKTVPCIVADDLTEEQVRAFRLADNRVGEFAEWDYDMLDVELADIFSIDMESLGFKDEDIDWAGVEDLHVGSYEPPEKVLLKCPCCGHKDEVKQFERVVE